MIKITKTIKYTLIAFIITGLLGFVFQINPAQAATPNYLDGTLLKGIGDNRVWVVINHQKVKVRSEAVFNACGFSKNKIVETNYTWDIPLATLLKTAGNPDIYVLDLVKAFKRKLRSQTIFDSYNLDPNKIATICPAIMDSYAWAPLMKTKYSNDVYRTSPDYIKHHYANMASFSADGMATKDIIEVSQIEIDSYYTRSEINYSTANPTPPTNSVALTATPVLYDPGSSVEANVSFPINWSSVANATSYTIERSNNPNFSMDFVSWQTTTTTWTNTLNPSITTAYYYRVKATNSQGSSSYSNMTDILAIASPSVCVLLTAPTLNTPQGSVASGTNFYLSWSSQTTATNYYLQRDTADSFNNPVEIYSGPSYADILQNIAPNINTTYYYRVRAGNTCGNSPWSNYISVAVTVGSNGNCILPIAPTLSVSKDPVDGNTNFTVSWTTGNSDIIKYALERDTNNTFNNTSSFNITNSTQYTQNLAPSIDTHYYYRVRGQNSCGYGAWSTTQSVKVYKVGVAPTSAPVLTGPSSVATNQYFNVSWTSVSGATGYTIEIDKNKSDFNPPYGGHTLLSSILTLQEYYSFADTWYYRVRADNDFGRGPWSATLSVRLATDGGSSCDLPTAVTINTSASTVNANDSFNLSWTAGSPSITTYFMGSDTSSSFPNNFAISQGLNTQATITNNLGLLSDTTYYYRIKTQNSCGYGPWSNTVSVILKAESANGAPTIAPILSGPSPAKINVYFNIDWTSISNATTYRLEMDKTFSAFNPAFFSYQFPSYILGGYNDYATTTEIRYYRVRAENSYGSGPWSNILQIVLTQN